MLTNARPRVTRRALAPSFAALAWVCLTPGVASATTVTFEWVSTSFTTAQTPPTTPSGTLTLTLPDSITTQTFDTGVLGGGSSAALAMIGSFSYTFSDGLTVNLANVNLGTSSVNPAKWYTSYSVDPDGVGPAPTGFYLLAGLNLNGNASGGTFQIANPAGVQGPPSNVGAAGNTITPSFPPWSSNDAGYWRMTSFSAPVPLPASLPLLLSGLALLGRGLARRRG